MALTEQSGVTPNTVDRRCWSWTGTLRRHLAAR